MLCGLPIVKPPATRARRSNVAVAGVVNFLYRRENSSTLSWGHKRLEVAGKMEVISAHNRLRSRNRLWQLYNAETTAAGVEPRNRLQRTAFFAVVGQITTRDLKVWRFIVRCLIVYCLMFFVLSCVFAHRPAARVTPRSSPTALATLPSCAHLCKRCLRPLR